MHKLYYSSEVTYGIARLGTEMLLRKEEEKRNDEQNSGAGQAGKARQPAMRQ